MTTDESTDKNVEKADATVETAEAQPVAAEVEPVAVEADPIPTKPLEDTVIDNPATDFASAPEPPIADFSAPIADFTTAPEPPVADFTPAGGAAAGATTAPPIPEPISTPMPDNTAQNAYTTPEANAYVPPVNPQQPYGQQPYNQQPYGQPSSQMAPAPKDRVVAGILGILLGSLGIHKFYLGYTTEGVIALVISVLGTCLFGLGPLVMAVIGIVEGCIYLFKSPEEFNYTYVLNKRGWF